MSLALSFLGGMAKRGMQINDEKREVQNRIDLETKLTKIREESQMRKASAARNAERSKLKEESIAMFKALGGDGVDQATLNYVTGLPTVMQNSLLEKMQGPNAVDLNALVQSQQITGDDGTMSSQFNINRDQFNKQYRVQQDTLSAEIESFSLVYANNPTQENLNKLQQLTSLAKSINGDESLERMSISTLTSLRNSYQSQAGLTEERDGKVALKRMEFGGGKEFSFLKNISDANENESSFILGGEKYSNTQTINSHLDAGVAILDDHIEEVMANRRSDKITSGKNQNVVVVSADQYYQYNQAGQIAKDQTLNKMFEIMEANNNMMIQFMNNDDLIQYEMLVGNGQNKEFYGTQETYKRLGVAM
jgi:hypothetical protein